MGIRNKIYRISCASAIVPEGRTDTLDVPLGGTENNHANANSAISTDVTNVCASQNECVRCIKLAAEGAATEELLLDPEKIMREHRELREATLCKICLDKTISVVFLPCGHLVTCPDCAPAMRKCPICRSLIKGMVKTFFG